MLQYATLFSLLIGGLGLAVEQAVSFIRRRSDHKGTAGCKRSRSDLAQAGEDFAELRVDFAVAVHGGPHGLAQEMLQSAERRLRSPLFAREWEVLRSEFESFPEFLTLVNSVQKGLEKC